MTESGRWVREPSWMTGELSPELELRIWGHLKQRKHHDYEFFSRLSFLLLQSIPFLGALMHAGQRWVAKREYYKAENQILHTYFLLYTLIAHLPPTHPPTYLCLANSRTLNPETGFKERLCHDTASTSAGWQLWLESLDFVNERGEWLTPPPVIFLPCWEGTGLESWKLTEQASKRASQLLSISSLRLGNTQHPLHYLYFSLLLNTPSLTHTLFSISPKPGDLMQMNSCQWVLGVEDRICGCLTLLPRSSSFQSSSTGPAQIPRGISTSTPVGQVAG